MLRNLFKSYIVLTILLASTFGLQSCNQASKSSSEENTATAKQEGAAPAKNLKHILFFGTSLTAGYGLDVNEAYPALIQKKIDSLQLPYQVVNAGLSGETSAAGKERLSWVLKQPVDIFVLELGSNDGLRGVAVKETTQNLQYIIDQVKKKYPDIKIILAGMQMPPNLGAAYTGAFKNMYPALAKQNNLVLVPFLLQGVGGIPKLNQADGIHPTAEGQKILASNVWKYLQPAL